MTMMMNLVIVTLCSTFLVCGCESHDCHNTTVKLNISEADHKFIVKDCVGVAYWKIWSPPGTRVRLRFEAFNMTTGHDFLKVGDLPGKEIVAVDTQLATFGGSELPSDVTSLSNGVWIQAHIQNCIYDRIPANVTFCASAENTSVDIELSHLEPQESVNLTYKNNRYLQVRVRSPRCSTICVNTTQTLKLEGEYDFLFLGSSITTPFRRSEWTKFTGHRDVKSPFCSEINEVVIIFTTDFSKTHDELRLKLALSTQSEEGCSSTTPVFHRSFSGAGNIPRLTTRPREPTSDDGATSEISSSTLGREDNSSQGSIVSNAIVTGVSAISIAALSILLVVAVRCLVYRINKTSNQETYWRNKFKRLSYGSSNSSFSSLDGLLTFHRLQSGTSSFKTSSEHSTDTYRQFSFPDGLITFHRHQSETSSCKMSSGHSTDTSIERETQLNPASSQPRAALTPNTHQLSKHRRARPPPVPAKLHSRITPAEPSTDLYLTPDTGLNPPSQSRATAGELRRVQPPPVNARLHSRDLHVNTERDTPSQPSTDSCGLNQVPSQAGATVPVPHQLKQRPQKPPSLPSARVHNRDFHSTFCTTQHQDSSSSVTDNGDPQPQRPHTWAVGVARRVRHTYFTGENMINVLGRKLPEIPCHRTVEPSDTEHLIGSSSNDHNFRTSSHYECAKPNDDLMYQNADIAEAIQGNRCNPGRDIAVANMTSETGHVHGLIRPPVFPKPVRRPNCQRYQRRYEDMTGTDNVMKDLREALGPNRSNSNTTTGVQKMKPKIVHIYYSGDDNDNN